jgi:hypothetical protein
MNITEKLHELSAKIELARGVRAAAVLDKHWPSPSGVSSWDALRLPLTKDVQGMKSARRNLKKVEKSGKYGHILGEYKTTPVGQIADSRKLIASLVRRAREE